MLKLWRLLTIYIHFAILQAIVSGNSICQNCSVHPSASTKLFRKLFENAERPYIAGIDPVDNILTFQLGVAVYSLVVNYVDELRQVLLAPISIVVSYADERLKWDANATGLAHMRVSRRYLWQPNVHVVNKYFGSNELDSSWEEREPAMIYPDGRAVYTQVLKDELKCKFDNYKFPLDTQLCFFYIHASGMRIKSLTVKETCSQLFHVEEELLGREGFCERMLKNFNQNLKVFEPAGWEVLPGEDDNYSSPYEALQPKYGKIFFRLQRKSTTDVIVWVITPILITTLAINSIFYLWLVGKSEVS